MLTKTEPVSLGPIELHEAKNITAILSDQYGLFVRTGSITRFLEKTLSSRVYRAVLADGRAVVVKESFWYNDPGAKSATAGTALQEAFEVSELLAKRGVPLPRVYPKARALEYPQFVFKDEATDSYFSVLDFCSGEHFSGRMEEFGSSGAALGKFHREGRLLGHGRRETILEHIPFEKPYEESRTLWDNGLRETLLADHPCAFPEVCASFRENISLIERIMALVDTSEVNASDRVSGIVHNDFHVNNGLYRADGSFSCFLDIDQMSHAPLVWDIGNTLVSLVSNFITERSESGDIELVVREFLVGYRGEFAISREELLLITAAGLRWDLLRILRSLRRHRFEDDRLSGLYGKLKIRLIPRFERIPEIFAFITPEWLEKNC
ncbi:MAG: phosphotransferase [Candidatus Vogelbacteria bacterium]|nr:phosphotransferase [Candidatus Vogelbacteria bacterium]